MDLGTSIVALSGVAVGAMVTLSTEWLRAKAGDRASRRDALLLSCSNFTAAVARTQSLSYEYADHKSDDLAARLRLQIEEARVECERLRLLLDAKEPQRAARMAIRHLYAIWHVATRGTDPRADEYPGVSPEVRLRGELTRLYAGVRRETGSRTPDEVFEELV